MGSIAGQDAATSWTCATCGRPYPSEFAVCPLDATPRGESAGRSADALIGQVLGRTYRVVKILGQGGMARLYEAEHVRIDARYAVKVIHDDLARDPDQLVRFEREARAAGRIHSDHVVRLVDVLRTPDDRPCIVTELLEGEDLQALLDRVGKLAVVDAVPIARQICRAMAAAHAVGVVHRDLKPSNVFLCKRDGMPIVKVFDFGVAKLADDERLTRTDAVMGTAAYMAPEQARRAADAGPLADVYSVGAVMYHMLTGEPPYGSVPAVSRFALVLHEEPARPRSIAPEIPDGVEAVIQHAMARDPTVRVASPAAFDGLLAAFDRRISATIPAQPGPAGSASAGASGAMAAMRGSTGSPSASGSLARTAAGSAPGRSSPGTTSPGQVADAAAAAAGRPGTTSPGLASAGVPEGLIDPAAETSAETISRRARMQRPIAVVVAATASLGAGAWVAALLAALVGASTGGERALIAVMALVATAAVGIVLARRLERAWRSVTAVARQIQSTQRAVVAGVMTSGAVALLAHGSVAAFGGTPIGDGGHAVLVGVAAGLGLGWRRWKLDERVRRRIG